MEQKKNKRQKARVNYEKTNYHYYLMCEGKEMKRKKKQNTIRKDNDSPQYHFLNLGKYKTKHER